MPLRGIGLDGVRNSHPGVMAAMSHAISKTLGELESSPLRTIA